MGAEMIGERLVTIREWDWFRARLDLNSLDRSRRGERKIFYAEGDPEEGELLLVCQLSIPRNDAILARDQDAEAEVRRLVEDERKQLKALASTLDGLKEELSVDMHVAFEVSVITATTQELVCRVVGSELTW